MNLDFRKAAVAFVLLAAAVFWVWQLRVQSPPKRPETLPVPTPVTDAAHQPPSPAPAPVDDPIQDEAAETARGEGNATVAEQPGLTGSVQSAEGSPIAGAAVRIGDGAETRTVARTDGNGQFQVSGLKPGPALLTADHPDYIPTAVRVVLTQNRVTEVTVVLQAGGSAEGVVLKGGRPFSGASVMVYGTNTAPKLARSDESGRYRVNGLVAGEVRVECQMRVEGLQVPLSRQRQAIVEENRVTIVDIEFPDDDGSIAGLVTVNGQPAVGGSIQIYSAGERGESSATGSVGTDGHYAVEHAPPGELWMEVIAESAGVKITRQLSLTLRSGERVEKDIELGGHAVIEGAIENPAADQSYQVLLFAGRIEPADLQSNREPSVASLSADRAGRFRIDGIAGGVYTVVVVALSADAEQNPATYAEARTASRNLTLQEEETASVSFSF